MRHTSDGVTDRTRRRDEVMSFHIAIQAGGLRTYAFVGAEDRYIVTATTGAEHNAGRVSEAEPLAESDARGFSIQHQRIAEARYFAPDVHALMCWIRKRHPHQPITWSPNLLGRPSGELVESAS